MSISRREFAAAGAAALALLALNDVARAKEEAHQGGNQTTSAGHIAMLVYPGMTALDLIGPQYAFASTKSHVHLVGKSSSPVTTDTGVTIVPSCNFKECPSDLEVFFVPGGSAGTVTIIEDSATIDFVARRAGKARWVASVCTGSLVLGAAGLLQGHKATSHWLVREKVLPIFGAIPVDRRVVEDGNLVTGAGVSAGLDLGLVMVAHLKGDEYAKAVQLMEQYDPQPPFNAGDPQKAGPAISTMMTDMHASWLTEAQQAARRAMNRLTV